MHPREVHSNFFSNLQADFDAAFKFEINLETTLAVVAYDSINSGIEAFPVDSLTRKLRVAIGGANKGNPGDAQTVVDWLVSKSVINPYVGARVAFVHQSITEYLAALELAALFGSGWNVLVDKFRLKRWDQALFLAIGSLSKAESETFFLAVVDANYALALSASKYAESDQAEIVSRLLGMMPDKYDADSKDAYIIEELVESHKAGETIGSCVEGGPVLLDGEVSREF